MKRLPHNLKRMVQFFREYLALFEIGPPPVAQLPANAFLPQLAAKSSGRDNLQRSTGESADPLSILQQLAAKLSAGALLPQLAAKSSGLDKLQRTICERRKRKRG